MGQHPGGRDRLRDENDASVLPWSHLGERMGSRPVAGEQSWREDRSPLPRLVPIQGRSTRRPKHCSTCVSARRFAHGLDKHTILDAPL